MAVGETPAIRAPDSAHIAICPGCENPILACNFVQDATFMQCPRCGTQIRPRDINLYERQEDGHDE